MKKPNQLTLIKWWKEWRLFFLFLMLMLSFRSTVADWSHVPTGSMKPTLMEGDRILVDKLAYDLRVPFLHWRLKTWANPQRGDIVTFPSPETEILYVKRVIGLPGDSIELIKNRLIINDKPLQYEKDDESVATVLNQTDQENHTVVKELLQGRAHTIMVSHYFPSRTSSFTKMIIPEWNYMVLGDNRDNSSDSRIIGFIKRERIRGKARISRINTISIHA